MINSGKVLQTALCNLMDIHAKNKFEFPPKLCSDVQKLTLKNHSFTCKTETIQLLKDNIRKIFYDSGLYIRFLI